MLYRLFFYLLIPSLLLASSNRALQHKNIQTKNEQRVALVIGNNKYDNERLLSLKNPVNDARAMKKVLKKLGFKIYYGENLTFRQMDKKLNIFSKQLKYGGVGLFFFAGHGLELDGHNYLMGKDSNIQEPDDISYESLELDKVMDKMRRSKNRLNIVLLDACRNDPFSRSSGGGLAKVEKAEGMFIAYATGPGKVASDGDRGKNGIFTQEILRYIETPGVPIGRLFKKIKRGVYNKTNQKQRPWTHDDIIGSDFFFVLPDKNTKTQYKINQPKVEIKNTKLTKFSPSNKNSIPNTIVKARHILLNNEILAYKILSKMGSLTGEELKQKFIELAKKHSVGPSRVNGGQLGWFLKNTMVKEFSDEVFSMKVGTVSSIVRTQFGYHIIYLEDKKLKNTN